jgi:hypothetical protein
MSFTTLKKSIVWLRYDLSSYGCTVGLDGQSRLLPELLGALCTSRNWLRYSLLKFSGFLGKLQEKGVQVLYSVVLLVLWSTSTSQYWSISTLTMMYSEVLVNLSAGSVVLVFYDVESCCTVLTCTPITLEYYYISVLVLYTSYSMMYWYWRFAKPLHRSSTTTYQVVQKSPNSTASICDKFGLCFFPVLVLVTVSLSWGCQVNVSKLKWSKVNENNQTNTKVNESDWKDEQT